MDDVRLVDAIERIDRVMKACSLCDEVTLAGNGVNSSEAGLTLRWVLKVLRGEKTQEYWYDGEE